MAETTKKIQPAKLEAVAKIKQELGTNPDVILSDFRGMSFPQMTELRAKLTEKGTAFRVVRNSFARVAMEQAGLPDASAMLEGPTAFAFLGEDPSPAAKVMVDFARIAPLGIKGGVIGGHLYNARDVEALSRLPGRQQLLAMLLGTMNAPVRNLMYAMGGISTKLVRTLAAVAEKKAKEPSQGSAPAVAAQSAAAPVVPAGSAPAAT